MGRNTSVSRIPHLLNNLANLHDAIHTFHVVSNINIAWYEKFKCNHKKKTLFNVTTMVKGRESVETTVV